MSMTTETSNARGEVPYDRDLIAQMLDVCGHPKYTLDAYREQARLLRDADNAAVANVGTFAARGGVRGLVAKWRAEADEIAANNWTCNSNSIRARADELEAALAAEGVQAGEVEGPHGFIRWQDEDFEIEWLREWRGGDCHLYLSQQPEARPSDDDLWDQTLEERDRYHDMADQLAEQIAAITEQDIGEHSSANCPWQNALLAADEYVAARFKRQVFGNPQQPDPKPEARGVVGELVQMGDDEDGHPRLIINTTREAIKASNLVPFSQVEVRNG